MANKNDVNEHSPCKVCLILQYNKVAKFKQIRSQKTEADVLIAVWNYQTDVTNKLVKTGIIIY